MENGHCNGKTAAAEAISVSELPALLIEMGAKLMDPPEDLNEKLALLDRVDHLFYGLGQQPSFSVRHALLPAMEALISDKLFGNSDMFVKVSSLSCIHELIRITAPDAPFSDETMKEIFRQTVKSFEYLSLNSGRCYDKALKILECVSKVRSGLILLDLGCEQLVVRMFHLFLNGIRSDHSDDIVLHMEELMTWLIEETDEVSSEILRPLLMSITEENQVKSPSSWRLGMKVLKNCTTRVKPYILKVVGQLKRDLESFTNAVSLVWPDTPAEDNVRKEADKDASGIVQMQGDGIAEQIEQLPVIVQMQGDGMAEHIEQLPVIAQMQGDGMSEQIEQPPVIPQMQGDGMAEQIEQPPVIAQMQGAGMAEQIEQPPVIAQMQGDGMAEQIEQPPVIAEGCAIPDSSGSGRQTEIKTEVEVVVQRRKRGRPRKLVDGFVLSGTNTGRTSSETPRTRRKRTGTALEDAAEQTHPKRRTRSKEENEFREELIGSRVKVWWPDDQAYYEGIVSSYDPTRKRHKVVYVDGDVESLRLSKERWSLVNGTSTSQGHQEPNSSHVLVDESEKVKTSMEGNDKEIQEKKDDASSSKESIQSQLKKHVKMSGASQSQPEKHDDVSGASQSQPEKHDDVSGASQSQPEKHEDMSGASSSQSV